MKVVVILAMILATTLSAACIEPAKYWWAVEIPADYRGYLVVQFNDPSCETFPVRDGYEVIEIDVMGRGCTSQDIDRYDDVWGKVRFFVVYADGQRVEIISRAVPQPVELGGRYGTVNGAHGQEYYRMVGWAFVPPHGDPYVEQAVVQCAWRDLPCWRVLRKSPPSPDGG